MIWGSMPHNSTQGPLGEVKGFQDFGVLLLQFFRARPSIRVLQQQGQVIMYNESCCSLAASAWFCSTFNHAG